MNPMLEKLKKLKKNRNMSDAEQEGKMSAAQSLGDLAKEAMGKRVSGLKKVTVSSDSEEGLEKGLIKAKEIVGNKKSLTEMAMPEEDESEMSEDEENSGHEDMEDSEDMEASEDMEKEEPEHALDEKASPEELDAEIERLMELKKQKEQQS